jgi:hypothetical protein
MLKIERAGSIVGFFLLGFANLLLCALDYATCVRCQVRIIQVIVGNLYLFLVCKETLIDTNSRYFLNLFNNVCTFTREAITMKELINGTFSRYF